MGLSWVGKIPLRGGKQQPPLFLIEKSHGQKPGGVTVHDVAIELGPQLSMRWGCPKQAAIFITQRVQRWWRKYIQHHMWTLILVLAKFCK